MKEFIIGDKVIVRDAGSIIIGHVEDVLREEDAILVRIENSTSCRWYDMNIAEKVT